MQQNHFTKALGPQVSRVRDVLAHIPRYSGRYIAELAMDAGLSVSTVSRIINRQHNPTYGNVIRITEALERKLGFHIDPRELIAENGAWLSPSVCTAVRCPGCLPEVAYDEFGDRKQAFAEIKPGHWVSSKYPNGFTARKESK